MNYEINIALNGSHFFATQPRSITDMEKLQSAFKILTLKFPAEEGYSLSVSYHPGISYSCSRRSFATAMENNDVDALFKSERS